MWKIRTFTNPWKNLLLCLFNHRLVANEPSEGKYPEASAGHALCHLFEYTLCFAIQRQEFYGNCLPQHTAHRFHPESFKIEWKCQSWCAYIYIYCRYNHYVTYVCIYIYVEDMYLGIYIYMHTTVYLYIIFIDLILFTKRAERPI